jgi:hypothetical protein
MSAPKGNNNAEVWTEQSAKTFFDSILKYVQENKKCRSLSEASVECGEYEELISYLQNKFNTIDFKSIKRAKDIVKNRLAQQGLDGEANPTMAIFLLKNNHNMTDRQQTDVTTNGKELNTAPIIKFVDSEDGD